MGVKVVPFILFVLAGECLSSLTEHQQQVQDVLEKMYHKITGIDEKLSKIEDRVTELENSRLHQTPGQAQNPRAPFRRNPGSHSAGRSSVCSLPLEMQPCYDWNGRGPFGNGFFTGRDELDFTGYTGKDEIYFDYMKGLCQIVRMTFKGPPPKIGCITNANKFHSLADCRATCQETTEHPCENKQCGDRCLNPEDSSFHKDWSTFFVEKHCQPDGSCKPSIPHTCPSSYRSLVQGDPEGLPGSPDSKNKTVKLCFNHTQLCNDEDLPDQCRTYNTLTDTNRLTARMHLDTGSVDEEPTRRGGDEKISDHSGDPNQSEEWQGEGWYRFKNGEPGIRMAAIHEQMATKADENCGANNGAYWNTEVQEIPNGFGENKDSTVKFGSDIKDMKVTNCGRFFVYFLPNAPPDYGYCFVRVTMKDFKENVEVYSD